MSRNIVMERGIYQKRLMITATFFTVIGMFLGIMISVLFINLNSEENISKNALTIVTSENGYVTVEKGAIIEGNAIELIETDTNVYEEVIKTPYVADRKMNVKCSSGTLTVYYDDASQDWDYERLVDKILD